MCCVLLHTLRFYGKVLRIVGSCCAKFETYKKKLATCKLTQQLPTVLSILMVQQLLLCPLARSLRTRVNENTSKNEIFKKAAQVLTYWHCFENAECLEVNVIKTDHVGLLPTPECSETDVFGNNVLFPIGSFLIEHVCKMKVNISRILLKGI